MPTRANVFTIVQGKDDQLKPIFAVLLKRSYRIGVDGVLSRAETDAAIREVDAYYDNGDAEWSTVQFENDLYPFKPFTDVVVVGSAYSPGGKPTAELNIGVEVAGQRKVIRVTGDRCCSFRPSQAPVFTDPVPFTEMQIRYERAYGGFDINSVPGLEFHYPRNPSGKGVVIENRRELVEGLVLPNIEDPADLLTPDRVLIGEAVRWNEQPLPAGTGWVARTWYPRCSFVGAMPGFVSANTVMREESLGIVPAGQIALSRQFKLPSYDVRFANGASLGLQFRDMRGGEMIRLANLTPGGGVVSFVLPAALPAIGLDLGQGAQPLSVVIHTVCIEPAEQRVDIVYRGALQYPGIDWLPNMTRLDAVFE